MAIYPADIRTQLPIFEGQFPESGGRPGPNELVNNEVGLLFPKVTEIAHAGGQVDLSKLFQWVKSPNTDLAARSYTFIDRAPADPLASCALFRANPIGSRDDHTNVRADLQSYVESYQIAASLSPWFLRGLHPAGISTIFLWSLEEVRQPETGEVLYLVQHEGSGGEYGQYVQIIGVNSTIETYQHWDGTSLISYQRAVHQCAISQRTGQEFIGPEVSYISPDSDTGLANVRGCVVAEAARYHGTANLTADVAIGEQTAQIDSVYTQIAPVARGEQGLADEPALSAGAQTIQSGGEDFVVSGPVHTYAAAVTPQTRATIWNHTMVPIPATGGKVHCHARILDRWYTIIEGESSPVGSVSVNRASGTGTLALTALPDEGSYILWEWPAAIHYTNRAGHVVTAEIVMRGETTSQPAPGTVAFAWTSGGSGKTAAASASGGITGDATGHLNPEGMWWLDFGSNLPDFGTPLELTWNDAGSQELDIFDPLTPSGQSVTGTLSQEPEPGTVRMEWETQRQIEKLQGFDFSAKETIEKYGDDAIVTIGPAEAQAAEWGSTDRRTIQWRTSDDGAGNLKSGGAIDYVGKNFSLDVIGDYDYEKWDEHVLTWYSHTGTETFRGRVVVRYSVAGGGTPHSVQRALPEVRFKLFEGLQDAVIPGTVRFSFGGTPLSDRDGGGTLYRADGVVAGAINYVDGEVSISTWSSNSAAIAVQSSVTSYGQWTQTDFAYRTAGAPLAPSSLQVNATDASGTLIQGDCDSAGDITGTGIDSGTCEQDIGFVTLSYTNAVWATTLKYNAVVFTTVPLDPAIIGIDPVRLPQDGRVIGIRAGDYVAIFHDTVENAPNPLGLGQVVDLGEPRIAWAYIADGVGEEQATLPSGIVGGQVVDLHAIAGSGRTCVLEYAVLEDSEARFVPGDLYEVDFETWEVTFADPLSLVDFVEPLIVKFSAVVDPDDYDVDLDAGTITMSSQWAKTGLTEPLKINWRYQDVLVCSEAQTTGKLALLSETTHAYDAGDGVSSLLQHGDLQARVMNVFSENTTPGDWEDFQQGDSPSGGGNFDAEHIKTSNDGAIRERWRARRRSDTQWDIIGETRGLIGVWDGVSTYEAYEYTWQDKPYFWLFAEGVGGGWATGNIFQWESAAAQGPFAVLRCIRPGAATVPLDSIRIRHRLGGD